MPLAAQPIILFNPEGRTANYIIPGLVAVMMQMIAVMLAAGSIVREREKGTMEQLMVTPVNPLGLMLGKVAPYCSRPRRDGADPRDHALRVHGADPGSLVFLFAIMIVYLSALLALGLFISTRAKTQQEAQQKVQMLLLAVDLPVRLHVPAERHAARPAGIGQSCRPRTWSRSCAASCCATRAWCEMLPHVGALVGSPCSWSGSACAGEQDDVCSRRRRSRRATIPRDQAARED